MSYVTDKFDKKVIDLLKEGGVGFMPSDTIYGISCRAMDEPAVERIYKFKYRFSDKPFIVLISEIEQAALLKVPTEQMNRVEQYWPGGLTLICEAPNAPEWLQRGTKTLALRVPAHNQLRQLISKVGPIVSTSANLRARKPAASLAEAKSYFDDKLDFYVDVGELMNRQPSTIVKIVDGKFQVLRQGAVKLKKEH